MATKALNYTAAEINQRLNLAGTAVQPNALNDYYTKTEVDGKVVVDLSTRYNTSYANLSAALAALNSDTATDASAIKKGGVSIKFINSTTNKYEQWNLKSSSWSTTESDWVSVTDVKAEDVSYGSSNVKEEINNLQTKIFSVEDNGRIVHTSSHSMFAVLSTDGYAGGKNLLSNIVNGTYTDDTISVTVDDGIITINGNTTGGNKRVFIPFSVAFESIPSTEYNLKCWLVTGTYTSNNHFKIELYNTNNTSKRVLDAAIYKDKLIPEGISDVQSSLSSDTDTIANYMEFYFPSGDTYNDLQIKPMLTCSERYGAGEYSWGGSISKIASGILNDVDTNIYIQSPSDVVLYSSLTHTDVINEKIIELHTDVERKADKDITNTFESQSISKIFKKLKSGNLVLGGVNTFAQYVSDGYVGAKNLMSGIVSGSYISNGISVVVADGAITINGIVSSTTKIFVPLSSPLKFVKSKSYNLKCWFISGSYTHNSDIALKFCDNTSNSRTNVYVGSVYASSYSTGVSDVSANSHDSVDTANYICVQLTSGDTYTNLQIKPMLTTSARYEAGDYAFGGDITYINGNQLVIAENNVYYQSPDIILLYSYDADYSTFSKYVWINAEPINSLKSYKIDADGTISSNSSRDVYVYQLKQGETVRFKSSNDYSQRWAMYSSYNGTMPQTYIKGGGYLTTYSLEYFEITAENDCYIAISCLKGITPDMKICTIDNSDIRKLTRRNNAPTISGYNGQSIASAQYDNILTYRELYNIKELQFGNQGMDVYDNYIVIAKSSSSNTHFPVLYVLNMDTDTLHPIYNSDLSILGNNSHNNTLSFSDEFYASSDILPLLYISNYTQVQAVRITFDKDMNAHASIVRTISFGDSRNYHQIAFDKSNNKLIVVSIASNPEKFYITTYNVPLADVTLTLADAITDVEITNGATSDFQGLTFYKNRLYWATGSTAETARLRVFEADGTLVNIIDLYSNGAVSEEIEDLSFVADNSIIVNTATGRIIAINF